MKLFISYARVDTAQVVQIVEILRSGGHDPWFDHRLLPGQDWKQELHNAVAASDAIVYMLTPESVASEWCQWEFADAVKLKKPVVPVLLREETQVPPVLSRFQFANFSSGVTPHSVAKLMGGLTQLLIEQPIADIPDAPENPIGIPAQVVIEDNLSTDDPAQTLEVVAALSPPDVSEFLPPPFAWCEIPAGKVTLVAGGYVKKPTVFDVDRFWIAKYPITNAQYQVFVDAKDGYANGTWWDYSTHAHQWWQRHPRPEITGYSGNDLPRTKVTWYESVAFGRWLTARAVSLHSYDAMPDTSEKWGIRLATEQEWQRAAQGDDGLDYPWGDGFDPRRANTEEGGVGRPTAVTRFERGASPFGVMNMSGNVWEWCLTDWESGNGSMNSDHYRVLRGGSWGSDQSNARAALRYVSYPFSWYGDSYFGFRVAAVHWHGEDRNYV